MPEKDPCEVYMRYLPRSCTEAALREKFEKCGRITRVWLSVDRATGECKGFGFVTFSSKTEARRCVKDYNEHPRNYMDGKHVVPTLRVRDDDVLAVHVVCLLYTSPSPRDVEESRMPSSA